MFPGMVYAILSRDPDFVENLSLLLRAAGGEVYAASSWDEYARIQQEGVVVEMWWSQHALLSGISVDDADDPDLYKRAQIGVHCHA